MKPALIKKIIFTGILLTGVLSCIHPVYPEEQLLQHLGTLVLLVPVGIDLKKNRLSLFAFACVSLFIIFHIIGARYIYSFVPYSEWIKSIFQVDINTLFPAARNNYDRFVHFIFGVLFLPFFVETLRNKSVRNKILSVLIAWAFIQALSMLYEVFEWMLTLVMSSEAANNYNGQQGDMWDAQKDMAIAMLGSTLMAFCYLFRKAK
jgi:putative membrane protein